jgi:hypothetical protein
VSLSLISFRDIGSDAASIMIIRRTPLPLAALCLAFLASALTVLYLSPKYPASIEGGPGIRHGRATKSSSESRTTSQKPLAPLQPMIEALDVMQTQFFQLWLGTWTSSIDWTAAVLETYVSASLWTMSSALDIDATARRRQIPVKTDGGVAVLAPEKDDGSKAADTDSATEAENTINKYFSQLSGFYYGQNALSLRGQAFDDMLWVVLGWLESIKFIKLHAKLHWTLPGDDGKESRAWHGTQFQPAFAHRARVFYDLAAKGWDTSICGGGMVWSPYLKPYKNAITNQLFISASVGMYLYFPGDYNDSPFVIKSGPNLPDAKPRDPQHLQAAIEGYKWLSRSNMTNQKGLYVDGFHATLHGKDQIPICDDRNEMVFTYNQGVILSGQRGLWESTGSRSYLEDGYQLIESVINATGWQWDPQSGDSDKKGEWAGLGRDGILEEACDSDGSCSQNGQTFKGIFFHHLTLFCAPLPQNPITIDRTFAADEELFGSHETKCQSYSTWIIHNARAAYKTRDSDGKYGMWWHRSSRNASTTLRTVTPHGAVDYRNFPVPTEEKWVYTGQLPEELEIVDERNVSAKSGDLNERGRGRTVETQGGGVSVLRAMWEVTRYRSYDFENDKDEL